MKQTLTKLIYGIETNPKKTPFGILAGQVKGDSICNNSGWFNINGEKIGSGDLSMKDLETISKHISPAEVFLILSENDSGFNIPNHLDRTEPGKDYVVNKTTWVVGKDNMGGIILRVGDRNDKPEEDERDGVKYTKVSRKVFKKTIGVDSSLNTKNDSKKSQSDEDLIKNKLYELYIQQQKKQQLPAVSGSIGSIYSTSNPPSSTPPLQRTTAPAPAIAKSSSGVKKAGSSKFLTAALPGLKSPVKKTKP